MAKKKKKWTDYLAWGQMSSEWIIKNFPFVLFIVFLVFTYIANAHYSEKKIRDIQRLQKEVKELRWEYRSIKASLGYKSKQSEVLKAVKHMGLKPLIVTPNKIVISKTDK